MELVYSGIAHGIWCNQSHANLERDERHDQQESKPHDETTSCAWDDC